MRMGLYSKNSSAIFSRPIIGGRIVNDDGSNVIIFDHSNVVAQYYWQTEDVSFASSGYADTKSIEFDGTDDYVSVVDSSNLSFTDSTSGASGTDSAFSVGCWINLDDATSSGVFGKGYAGLGGEYAAWFDASDKINFRCGGQIPTWIGQISDSAYTSDEGEWHHWIFTYSGSEAASGLKIYRDSLLIADTESSNSSYAGMPNSSNTFDIGRNWGGFGAMYMNGHMDGISVWNVELTSRAITDLYNSGDGMDLGTASSALLAWYRCGNGTDSGGATTDSITTMYDNKGNYDGTLNSMSTDIAVVYPGDVPDEG